MSELIQPSASLEATALVLAYQLVLRFWEVGRATESGHNSTPLDVKATSELIAETAKRLVQAVSSESDPSEAAPAPQLESLEEADIK